MELRCNVSERTSVHDQATELIAGMETDEHNNSHQNACLIAKDIGTKVRATIADPNQTAARGSVLFVTSPKF